MNNFMMLDFPVGGAPAHDGGQHVDARLKDARAAVAVTTPTTGKESMPELNTAARRESARTSCDERVCRSAWPRKWWHTILYGIVDAALINAYALYADASPRPAMTRVAFLYDIIDALGRRRRRQLRAVAQVEASLCSGYSSSPLSPASRSATRLPPLPEGSW